MRIAIDLGNTISTPLKKCDAPYNEVMACKVISGAAKVIRKWHKEGHRIIIFTHRSSYLKDCTAEWLRKHKIPYTELRMEKPDYDILIDDKGLKFKDWKTIDDTLVIPELLEEDNKTKREDI